MLALVLLAAVASAQSVTVNQFNEYPQDSGRDGVTGTVTLVFSGTGTAAQVTLDWDLQGVDAACSSGGNGGNSCGIHIHEGVSCIDHALVGGHFYDKNNTSTDPWTVSFTSDGTGAASGTATVVYGKDYDASLYKTLVIHNLDASRATCTVIGAEETVVTISDWTVYPGYEGDIVLDSDNTVTLGFVNDAVSIAYSLPNGDSQCTTTGSAGNSCGIHIHAGTSCIAHSLVGGHYYDQTEVGTDPWTNIVYTPSADQVVATTVETGYDYAESEGRAFVVHGLDGGRVACALINKAETVTTLSSLGSYPGASGYDVAGSVTIGFVDDAVSIAYDLTGIDSECTDVDSSSANSCGIHIHSGNSCVDHSLVGGHYYNNTAINSDPWTNVVYVTTSGTEAVGAVQVADIGYSSATGLAFVTHDVTGARSSCTLIGVTPTVVTISSVSDYPTWTGTSYTGSVTLEFVGDRVSIAYDLANVDSDCTSAGTESNSCGIHIHSGTSCIDHALVGGHYYDTDTLSSDPWSAVVFTAATDGTAQGATQVTYDYTASDSDGRAFVIHDYSGARATCNLINQSEDVVTITVPGTYPGYTGTAITGSITLGFVGEKVSMSYNLQNVDAACTSPSSDANSCGIHIHAGTSCETADQVGGHYYDNAALDDDPWASIVFTTTSGTTNAVGVVPAVTYGYTYSETNDRAFVIHKQDGSRVSCAIIQEDWTLSIDSEALGTFIVILIILAIGVPLLCICIIVCVCCGGIACCCAAQKSGSGKDVEMGH